MNTVLTLLLAAAVVGGPVALMTGGIYLYAQHSVRMHEREEHREFDEITRRVTERNAYRAAVANLTDDDRAWLVDHDWNPKT